jgi:hypothetical protein
MLLPVAERTTRSAISREDHVISGEQLRQTFLPDAMKFYFERKLALLSASEVEIRIEELLKYLTMVVHCSGDIPFSKEIDDVWHYWILQTEQYEELCRKLPGGGFVHHSSNDYTAYSGPAAKTQAADVQRGVAFLASYVMNYGPFEKQRVAYWPLAGWIMERSGWSLPELNAWLGSEKNETSSRSAVLADSCTG